MTEGNSKPHVWKWVFNVPKHSCRDNQNVFECLRAGKCTEQKGSPLMGKNLLIHDGNWSSILIKGKTKIFFHRFHQTHDLLAGQHSSEWLSVPAVLRCISVLTLMQGITCGTADTGCDTRPKSLCSCNHSPGFLRFWIEGWATQIRAHPSVALP